MNSFIKPENIRIYRKPDSTYTIRPEGAYVPCLSHFDRLTSLKVSIYPSASEAKQDIEIIWRIGLPETLPLYLALSDNLPKTEYIPGLDRVIITVEDLTYLGGHLCTVGIVGFHSPQRAREKMTYHNCLTKINAPIHHQVLSGLEHFCRNPVGSSQSVDYRDALGRCRIEFAWDGTGIVVILSDFYLYDAKNRSNGLLTELIDHLKLDKRVTQIRAPVGRGARIHEYLRRTVSKRIPLVAVISFSPATNPGVDPSHQIRLSNSLS